MPPAVRPITVALLGTPEISADGRPFTAGNDVRVTPDAGVGCAPPCQSGPGP
jgi:hypothetical protein